MYITNEIRVHSRFSRVLSHFSGTSPDYDLTLNWAPNQGERSTVYIETNGSPVFVATVDSDNETIIYHELNKLPPQVKNSLKIKDINYLSYLIIQA